MPLCHLRQQRMANTRWFKGSKPTKMESFLHERMWRQSNDLVEDWVSRKLIPEATDVETLASEIQDLAETGNSIMS